MRFLELPLTDDKHLKISGLVHTAVTAGPALWVQFGNTVHIYIASEKGLKNPDMLQQPEE